MKYVENVESASSNLPELVKYVPDRFSPGGGKEEEVWELTKAGGSAGRTHGAAPALKRQRPPRQACCSWAQPHGRTRCRSESLEGLG